MSTSQRESTRIEILGSAIALRSFTTAQLCAYTGYSPGDVVGTIANAPEGIFAGDTIDPEVDLDSVVTVVDRLHLQAFVNELRTGIEEASIVADGARTQVDRRRTPHQDRRVKDGAAIDSLISVAQEYLKASAKESSSQSRQPLIMVAVNCLTSFRSTNRRDDQPEASPLAASVNSPSQDQILQIDSLLSIAKVALETTFGENVPLAEIATLTTTVQAKLRDAEQSTRMRPVFDCLVEVALSSTSFQSLSARALCHLASRRTQRRQAANVSEALNRYHSSLDQLSDHLRRAESGSNPARTFFQYLSLSDDGKLNVRVLSDLLRLLPSSNFQMVGDQLESTLVEAAVDSSEAEVLSSRAEQLETRLDDSVYVGESALIGTVASTLEEFAFASQPYDARVTARSDDVRKELLSLAGAFK